MGRNRDRRNINDYDRDDPRRDRNFKIDREHRLRDNQDRELKIKEMKQKLMQEQRPDQRQRLDRMGIKRQEQRPGMHGMHGQRPGMPQQIPQQRPGMDKDKRPGMQRPGIDKDKPGMDKDRIQRPGIDKDRMQRPGIDKDRMHKPGMDRMKRPGMDKDKPGMDRMQRPGMANPDKDKDRMQRPGMANPDKDRMHKPGMAKDKPGMHKAMEAKIIQVPDKKSSRNIVNDLMYVLKDLNHTEKDKFYNVLNNHYLYKGKKLDNYFMSLDNYILNKMTFFMEILSKGCNNNEEQMIMVINSIPKKKKKKSVKKKKQKKTKKKKQQGGIQLDIKVIPDQKLSPPPILPPVVK